MISKESAPVAWSSLTYELEDAQEHLISMIANMNKDADCGEENLRVNLGHVFSHLNRAWHRRENIEGLDEVEWRPDHFGVVAVGVQSHRGLSEIVIDRAFSLQGDALVFPCLTRRCFKRYR